MHFSTLLRSSLPITDTSCPIWRLSQRSPARRKGGSELCTTIVALSALTSLLKKGANVLIYWTLPRRAHLRCVWNHHLELRCHCFMPNRWRFARNWVSFLMTIRGSLMETAPSVSKWPIIYTSINKFRPVCARCHVGFFTYDYIALCPPKEVLEYLVKYVEDTPAGKQMPLYQVWT